jgi:hypothetical protein
VLLIDLRSGCCQARRNGSWTLERGRLAERLAKWEKAAQAYQYVADVWRNADPELQPYVPEAKQGLVSYSSFCLAVGGSRRFRRR